MNIGLFSPSKNPYSETFIQAHKKYLRDNVFYYYGTRGRIKLENHILASKLYNLKFRIERKISGKNFTYLNEKLVLHSIKKKKIDVILVEYGTHAFKLRDLLKSSNLPIVVHFHGHDISIYSTLKKCDNYKFLHSLSSRLIAVSKLMKDRLISFGFSEEQILLSPCAPAKKFELIQPEFSKTQFISVGRLIEKKGPLYSIMAFNLVANDFPSAKLLIAGDGPMKNDCINLVKKYKLEEQVIFLGIINHQHYSELLNESLAFVQHSTVAKNGDMEGTPVAILEASAAGLPVISTNHAGIPDVIINNQTGLLSEEFDIDAMADNMRLLLRDKEIAISMGLSGKRHIQENFTMERHIEVLHLALCEAVKKVK